MTRLDRPLLATWCLLLGFGLVMVSSASVAMTAPFPLRHGIYLAVAVLAFLAMLAMPLKFWRNCHQLALIAAIALCALLLIPGVATEVKGAKRWIDLGAFTLQPAEWAKAAFIVYLAGLLAKQDVSLREHRATLAPPVLAFILLAGMLALQPDLGTAVVIGGVLVGMFFLAGVRLRYFILAAPAGAALLALLAWALPHVRPRLISFTNPWADAYDSGYQLANSLIAFGRGESFGLGLGEGIQKLWYLPDAHNDFIYAVVAEELGLAGALALLALLALLVQRILHTARSALAQGRSFAAHLCYGIGLLIGLQVLINIGVTTGSLPTKGLTLPFISYGGNSLILCAALIGLVGRAQLEQGRQ